MQIKKPKFWVLSKPNFLANLLSPISKIVELFSMFKIENKKKYTNIKTICIGNIYIGGTGKTSLAIKIFKILIKRKIRVCFIKKYYSNQIDEIKLLENYGKVFSGNSRDSCIKNAIKENYEVAIFDDGLQDKKIDYDYKILCFNNINWVGNGLVIPAGPLRENLNKIKKYNFIFLNGNLENAENIKKDIIKINSKSQIFDGVYIPINLEEFDLSNNYLAFSGIGNHQTFISMLKKNNFNIIKDIEFPDHYNYKEIELDKIISLSNKLNCKIITTEKDLARIKSQNKNKFKIIKSELNIQDEDNFINAIFPLNE